MSGNREIAERFIASLEARDWEARAALLHPDVVYRQPGVSTLSSAGNPARSGSMEK